MPAAGDSHISNKEVTSYPRSSSGKTVSWVANEHCHGKKIKLDECGVSQGSVAGAKLLLGFRTTKGIALLAAKSCPNSCP